MMVVDFHEDDFEYDYLSTNTGQVTLSIQIATILLQAGMGLKIIPIVTR
jgi:hypothetical protein